MAERPQKVRERKDATPLPADHPKYQHVKDLSTGAFGVVQLCRNKRSGQLVAIKFLERVSHTVFLACGEPCDFCIAQGLP